MSQVKIILITTQTLPSQTVTSWPKMYDYYFKDKLNNIDYLICPDPGHNKYENVKYMTINEISIFAKLKFITGYKYLQYIWKLRSILKKYNKIVLKIIDDTGLLNDVHNFLKRSNKINNVRILFFSHGFSHYFENSIGVKFYNKIDHLIYLTYTSYVFNRERYSCFSPQVTVLKNGVDSECFFKLLSVEKNRLKEKMNIGGKFVLTWMATSTKMKGFDIFINAFKASRIYKNENYILNIIGCEFPGRDFNDSNIFLLGKKSSLEVSKLLQVSDFFFFTSLYHEGFGLSLIEAIKTGNTVIVSNIDPMKEVLMNGTLGLLVDDPHNVNSWMDIFNKMVSNEIKLNNFENEYLKDLYNIENWVLELKNILDKELNNFN